MANKPHDIYMSEMHMFWRFEFPATFTTNYIIMPPFCYGIYTTNGSMSNETKLVKVLFFCRNVVDWELQLVDTRWKEIVRIVPDDDTKENKSKFNGNWSMKIYR